MKSEYLCELRIFEDKKSSRFDTNNLLDNGAIPDTNNNVITRVTIVR